MSAFQQLPDIQERNQTKITEIWAKIIATGLNHVLQNLPPVDDYDITLEGVAPALNIGCVWPQATYAGDCTLHLNSVPRTYPDYSRNHSRPRHDWVAGMDHENIRKKGVFAWHPELYNGLFERPMNRRTAALLQYYILQWAANTLVSFRFSGDIDVDALCEALEMLGETEEFKARAPEIGQQQPTEQPFTEQQLMGQQFMEQELTRTSPTNGLMASDQDNNRDANRRSVRAILNEIRTSVPAVDTLPTLQDLNLKFEPHDKDERFYLPFRLYIGKSKGATNRCEAWMYMTYPQGKKQGVVQPCEMNLTNANGEVVGSRTLATGWSPDLGELNLAEPFKATKGSEKGSNYLPLTYVTQYCFLLKYEEEGVPINKSLIVINQTFKRYLENGVKFYQQSVKSKPTKSQAKPKAVPKIRLGGQKATRATRQQRVNYEEAPDVGADEEENYSYTPSATARILRERNKEKSSKGKHAISPPNLSSANNEAPSAAASADETQESIHTLHTADELNLRETQLQNRLSYSLTSVHKSYLHWNNVRETIPEEVLDELYEELPLLKLAEQNLSNEIEKQIQTWNGVQDVLSRMEELGLESQWQG
ncbi:uncharacterized protein N0V89_007958 [Didymosphaeria variabile]|uniref:Uncharacterized protein n=1 Tax=Didymosphaeria variabile TaxID=1932322 RepID=A0A9W8XEV3_9PLEO|nr:uncharacterized protein N0V89_007958 [Didymosphaeria variabile]KAJ4349344.1 hypothetical protein N0V89_007958 [Didymosphaeria variabile]